MAHTPDPLEPGHIPCKNPATPERMPGHTKFNEEKPAKRPGAGRSVEEGRRKTKTEKDLRRVENEFASEREKAGKLGGQEGKDGRPKRR